MNRTVHAFRRISLTLCLCCAWATIGAIGLAVGTTASAGAMSRASVSAPAAPLYAGGRYVSIGSSLASGDGIPIQSGGPCARSSNNYAQIVAATLQLHLDDESCSGAVIANVLRTSLDANLPQIDFVSAKTKLITVGLGGNDIDYNLFADECGLVQQCTPPANLTALEAALPKKLSKMLTALKTAAPNAKIVLVTYPQEFGAENCAALGLPDAAFTILQQMGSLLENDLVAAAQRAKVLLADPYAAGMGNQTGCAAPTMQWASPLNAVNSFPYHPTALGHEVMAGEILSALGVTLPAPSTTLIDPLNGVTVHGKQRLVAGASSGVTEVLYEITGGTFNDQVIATASPTVYGWLASWRTTTVPNGIYTLQSVATNDVGSTATSSAITIKVDNAS